MLSSSSSTPLLSSASAPADRQPYTKAGEVHSGTSTSWVPLITSNAVDPRCSSNFYSPDGVYRDLIAFDPRLEAIAGITCLPRKAADWLTQAAPAPGANGGSITSLGPMQCPEAYSTASLSSKDESSTRVCCCPTGFELRTATDQNTSCACESLQHDPVTVHVSTWALGASTEILEASTLGSERGLTGMGIDGWIFSTAVPATPQPTSADSQSNNNVPENPGLGLPENAVIGLILGTTFGATITLVALILLAQAVYIRHRAKRGKENCEKENNPASVPHVAPDEISNCPQENRVPSASATVFQHDGASRSSKAEESNGTLNDNDRVA